MASTNDLKNGMVLKLDNGQLWSVVEFQHVKPGKGPAFVRTKLKHVLSGKVVDKTFNAGVKVETASVDKRGMQFSYKDGADFVFMDLDTYDQIQITPAVLGDAANYLLEGFEATVAMYEGARCTSSCRPRSSWSSSTPSPASRATAPPAAPSRPAGDRPRDRRPAVHRHRREDQGRHPHR